jgi:hypothetical protein
MAEYSKMPVLEVWYSSIDADRALQTAILERPPTGSLPADDEARSDMRPKMRLPRGGSAGLAACAAFVQEPAPTTDLTAKVKRNDRSPSW